MNRWCDSCDAIVATVNGAVCPRHPDTATRSIAFVNAKLMPPGMQDHLEAQNVKVLDTDPLSFDFAKGLPGGHGDES